MNNQTEKMLNNGWLIVRDAGSAVADAASSTGHSLARNLPRVKGLVSASAGLAVARKGASVAVSAVRRHPVAAIAGAVALAGLGLVLAAAKRRREAQADANAEASGIKRIKARNMRGDSGSRASSKATSNRPAKTSTRTRKTSEGHTTN